MDDHDIVATYPAMLSRVEHVIETLRSRFVEEGWRLDHAGAGVALTYFRRIADGGPDDDDEWSAVVEFFASHNISFDWVLLGDPSGMICGAAARSRRATSPPPPPHLRVIVGGQPGA